MKKIIILICVFILCTTIVLGLSFTIGSKTYNLPTPTPPPIKISTPVKSLDTPKTPTQAELDNYAAGLVAAQQKNLELQKRIDDTVIYYANLNKNVIEINKTVTTNTNELAAVKTTAGKDYDTQIAALQGSINALQQSINSLQEENNMLKKDLCAVNKEYKFCA